MNDFNSKPNKQVSTDVHSAILDSLDREKISSPKRFIKAFIVSASVIFILGGSGVFLLDIPIIIAWVSCFAFLWVILLGALTVFFSPEPRLEIAGIWSRWTYAKLLIVMITLTIIEILICPNFVLLNSLASNSFDPLVFQNLRGSFLSIGGMPACMFLCGLIFSGLGSLFGFLLISKTLQVVRVKSLIIAVLLSSVSQLPIAILQLSDDQLRGFTIYWFLGSIVGILGVAIFFQVMSFAYRRYFVKKSLA